MLHVALWELESCDIHTNKPLSAGVSWCNISCHSHD